MAAERLETWQKWFLGIITAVIISGIPATFAYVVATHESVLAVKSEMALQNWRIEKLEEADKDHLRRIEFNDVELVKQSKEIFSLTAKMDDSYVARARIP